MYKVNSIIKVNFKKYQKFIICIILFLAILIYIKPNKFLIPSKFLIEKFNETVPNPSPSNSNTNIIKLDFIYPNPKYKDIKLKLEDGKLVEYKNEWEKELTDKLCTADDTNINDKDITPAPSDNACSCIKVGDENVCGKEYYRYVYECPNKCPNCKECLTTRPHVSKLECRNIEGNDKCERYKNKMTYSKQFYTSNDRKFIEIKNPGEKTYMKSVVRSNESQDLFLTTLYNDFLSDNDILIKIYSEEKEKEKGKITILNVYLNNREKKYDIFYEEENETNIFIIPNNSDLGLNLILKIKGSYLGEDFSIVRPINIFKREVENKLPETIFGKEQEEGKFEVKSYLDDKYGDNYLGISSIKTNNLYSNPTIYNEVKSKPEGEFVKKEILDSPETWKERIDINRPWISTFSEVFTDIFAEYNFDKKERSYEMNFIKENLKSAQKINEVEMSLSPGFDFYNEFDEKNMDMRELYKLKLKKDKVRFSKSEEEEKEDSEYLYQFIRNKILSKYSDLINIYSQSPSPSFSSNPNDSNKNFNRILKRIKRDGDNIVVLAQENNFNDRSIIIKILAKKKIKTKTKIDKNSKFLLIDNEYSKSLFNNTSSEINIFKNKIRLAIDNNIEIITYNDFLKEMNKHIIIKGNSDIYQIFLKFIMESNGKTVKLNTNADRDTTFIINDSNEYFSNKNIVIRDENVESITKLVESNKRVSKLLENNFTLTNFPNDNTILFITETEKGKKNRKKKELHIPVMTHLELKELLNVSF